MNFWKLNLLTVITLWCLLTTVSGQTTSRISTAFLARGEQALLEISVVGGQPSEIPEIDPVKDIAIQPASRRPMTKMLPGRKLEYVFEYIVAGYETGPHRIPPIEVIVDGEKTTTEPLDFVIFNPDELQWSEVESEGRIIRYASSFRTLAEQPFENQTSPTEIKIFIPEELVVDDWGIPDFERDGVTAWRFQPSPMRSRINLLGRPYVSVAYPSTITPTRSGPVSIGPAKVRLTTREVVQDPFIRQVNREYYLQVPKLELEASPLPEGAPAGFENAVGNFRIRASTATTEIQEGDPITVDLVITGSGNLDTLKPPKLESADGWKIYGTTSDPRGDERRQLSGTITFHQSIRPLEMKREIPAFELIYFDPKDMAYKTARSEPIALQMLPGASPPAGLGTIESLPVPFERMTDILAVLQPAQLTVPAGTPPLQWLGHLVGGLLALTLILKALWMRHAHRFQKNPKREARLNELKTIEQNAKGDAEFLKAAGGFIERWLGANSSPEITSILKERDSLCFRQTQPDQPLSRKRRSEILSILQKASMAFALILTLGSAPPLQAEDLASKAHESYLSARYDDAIRLWLSAGNYQELSADTLYNIGNACYRSGSAGHAALYFRRALLRDPNHQEARQNLRFIERKYGAITVQRPDYQYALARIPLTTWQAVTWAGLWMFGISMLVFPATRSGARIRIAAVAALLVSPVMILTGGLGWRYFPSDAEFAPAQRQAVIITENVTLHTDASRTAPEVIDAPPGSLCEVIQKSGRWAYIAFATKTRGWVPHEAIENVVPEEPPAVPKFRKPKADGNST
jgi:tetratricopeptide (TPR) repeat protein